MIYPRNTLDDYRPYRDKQDHGIKQGSEDSSLFISVSEFHIGLLRGHLYGKQSYKQTENIAQIVSGIRQQPYGIGHETDCRFDSHEQQIQRYAQNENSADGNRCVMMVMAGMAGAIRLSRQTYAKIKAIRL